MMASEVPSVPVLLRCFRKADSFTGANSKMHHQCKKAQVFCVWAAYSILDSVEVVYSLSVIIPLLPD